MTAPARPVESTTMQRPVKATLHVHLDNGETWEATEADLDAFRLASRLGVYMVFRHWLASALDRADLLDGDLTDCELNPVRYLAETAICHPDLLAHDEHEGWEMVAELERRLRRETEMAGLRTAADGLRETMEIVEANLGRIKTYDRSGAPGPVRRAHLAAEFWAMVVSLTGMPEGATLDEARNYLRRLLDQVRDGDNAEPGQEDIADHGDDDGTDDDGELADDLPPGS